MFNFNINKFYFIILTMYFDVEICANSLFYGMSNIYFRILLLYFIIWQIKTIYGVQNDNKLIAFVIVYDL